MEHLWASTEPQTVRQVHEALATRRSLAYTTVMTIQTRLLEKGLVAGLMVDALDQADSRGRTAALVHFVGRVGADEAAALREALAALEAKEDAAAGTADQRTGRAS